MYNSCTVFNTFKAGLIQAVHVKTSCSHMALRRHNPGTKCIRELFKCSKDSASLVVCNEKNYVGFGFPIFCEWRHKWSSFRPLWPTSPGPEPKPLDGSILLKFLLGTRLKSESFDTLDDLLWFWVQMLWSKAGVTKPICYRGPLCQLPLSKQAAQLFSLLRWGHYDCGICVYR